MKSVRNATDILVKCGFGDFCGYAELSKSHILVKDDNWPSQSGRRMEKVNPFADTIEGRRQADAIEDWLQVKCKAKTGTSFTLWGDSLVCKTEKNNHQWRLNRIKWCLEKLLES